ncbi:MAG: SUMF1/EgtB/PvdO family nonheme iron enzyme [Ramlibacter sp.]
MSAPAPAITPDAIDSPGMRHAGHELLSLALMDARNHTLNLLAHYEQALGGQGMQVPQQDDLEPPLWLVGHLGWFAEFWIGRNTQRGLGPGCPAEPVRLASIEPHADRWWSPMLVPHEARWLQQLPDVPATRAWLLDTLETTLELLDKTPDEDDALYFYRLALFHEDLRGEQLISIAQVLGLPLRLDLPGGVHQREPLVIPATPWLLGLPPGGFVFDTEKWGYEVAVPEFEIDAQPVSWAQFVEFVDDGGYDRPELWLPEGWDWLQKLAEGEGRRGPRYVEQIGVASGAVMQMHFGRSARMAGSQSTMHVSWWEADAWCRWAGRRLPAEVEWEVAAHAAARRGFRWGDVREWTATTLRPWPGFSPDPWTHGADWSAQPWWGRAKVQRGASFATRARMKHPKVRSFALPGRDDGFVGFRSCAL